MDEGSETALAKLFAAIWDAHTDSMGMDADEIETMLDNSGLTKWIVVEPGKAPILLLTAEGKTIYLMGTTKNEGT